MTPAAFLPPILQPPHDPTSWLLDARAGWKSAVRDGVEARPLDGSLALAPRPGTGRSLTEPSGSFGGLRTPANVAIDAEGWIYLLDPTTATLKRFDPCACGFVEVACFPVGPRFKDPHGIAICRGDLFVCDTGHHRVVVVSLPTNTPRGEWRPPSSPNLKHPWQPLAIAFDGRGRAFVSDPVNGMVHRFDVSGRWEHAFPGLGPVTDLAVDCLDRVHIVVEGAAGVRTIDADGTELVHAEPLSRPDLLAGVFPAPPFPVDIAGNLHLGAFLPPECRPAPPCPTDGRSRPGPVPEAGVFDLHGNSIDGGTPAAGTPPAYLLPGPGGAPSGTYRSEPLDSALYRCSWHRVVLTGRVPKGTRVNVATVTSEVLLSDDQLTDLPEDAWETRQDIANLDGEWDGLIRSGPGRFLWLRLRFFSNGSSTPAFERIIVEFPRISLRRYLPAVFGVEPVSADFTDRFLANFDTLLRGIERTIDTQARFFDPLSTPSARDPNTGVDFLSWLAGWIGVSLNRQWPEAKRRRFLKQAGAVFDIRGTREGLRRQLLLYLGMEPGDNPCNDDLPRACCPPKLPNCRPPAPRPPWQPPPLILEHFMLRRWLSVGRGRLGSDAVLWGQQIVNRSQLGQNARVGVTKLVTEQDPYRDPFHVEAHRFTVFVPARFGADAAGRKALDTLIKSESPAHTSYEINYVRPLFRVGIQATVGLDAVVARVPEGFTLGEAPLGGAPVLTGPPGSRGARDLQIGKRGRIGNATLG